MFNLKEKTRLNDVQIFSKEDVLEIVPVEALEWGLGFETSAVYSDNPDKQKRALETDKYRVRIYNVY